MKRILISALALVSTQMSGVPGSCQAQESTAPFSIHISAAQSVAPVGAHVRISVVLTNTSSETIGTYIDAGGNSLLSGYQAHLYDAVPRHMKMSWSAWIYARKGHADDDKNDYSDYKDGILNLSGGWGPLKPGQDEKTSFDLSDAYQLDHPGHFTVCVTHEDPKSGVIVRSNTIAITVTDAEKK